MSTSNVKVAFGELGRVLEIEVDEFDKIIRTITSLIQTWTQKNTFYNNVRPIPTEVKLKLERAEELFITCKGSTSVTPSRTWAMDLLQDIPLILLPMMKLESNPRYDREMILRPKGVEEIARVRKSFNDRVWINWENIIRTVKHVDFEKNYLVVLEEFPNENCEKWFGLLEPLLSAFAKCKPGTKIIFTTSSASLEPHVLLQLPVAKGAPFPLRPLKQEDYLAFFRSMIAFRGSLKLSLNSPLTNIGYETINKCNNPRAIRIVASFFSFQYPTKWNYFNEFVLNIKNPAKHIIQIYDLLQQGHHYLNFFSLFPVDYEFNKVEYYQFLDVQQSLPESFKETFEMLLGNENLFTCCTRDKSGVIVSYKVHALVRLVAKCSSRNTCLMTVSPDEEEVPKESEHVSCIVDSECIPSDIFRLDKNFKSFLLLSTKFKIMPHSLNKKMEQILKWNRRLQALDFAIVDCRPLMDFIAGLTHLRYLRLGVSSESLPVCITNLKLLQILDLRYSRVRELPVGFNKLSHLKHLYIGDRLIDLPPSFGELTGLQTLDVFIVGNNNGLDTLACFTHLAGKLRIRYQKGREEHVLQENTTFLKDKKLYELSLEWLFSNAEPAAAEKYKKEDDMESELLQLPSTLKILTVQNWKGERFPKWSIDQFSSMLSYLVSIHIADCSRFKYLPSISKIGCLKSLELWGLIALEWIENCDDNSMVSSETPYFPSLEHLSLVNLPRLKGWSRVEEHNADYEQEQKNLPRLDDLRLSGCPQLISMPDMPALHSLEASNCHRDLLQHFLGVQASATVSSPSASAVVPVLQNLCSLKLSDMSVSEPLPRGLDCLTTLEEPSLSWLYNVRVLPESIGHLILLRHLVIRYLPNLLDLPESLSGLSALEHVEIQYCPRLKQVPSYFSELKSKKRLQIKECINLEKRCQQPDGEDYSTHL